MKKIIFASFLATCIASPLGAEAFFSKCDFMPKEKRPPWVSSGYEKDGYYTAVGAAEKAKKMDFAELQSKSKQNGYSNLAQNITVVVDSSIKSEQQVINSKMNKNQFNKDVSISSSLSAKEILSGVKVSGRWLDRKTCILYTSVEVKRTTVNRLKRETLMKIRATKLNELLDVAKDKEKEPDINKRKVAFNDARRLFKEINFKYLKSDLSKKAYQDKMNRTWSVLKKDIGSTKNRVLVAAIDKKGEVPESVLGELLDFVKNSVENADRLQGNCLAVKSCIYNAHKKGFSHLVVLDVSTNVEVSEMGAYKGVLTIDKTVFDVSSSKILKGPNGSFAEIISWSDDDLDWNLAVEKIISSESSMAGI